VNDPASTPMLNASKKSFIRVAASTPSDKLNDSLLGGLYPGLAPCTRKPFLTPASSPKKPSMVDAGPSVYQARILQADRVIRNDLCGLGWPPPHRVVPNGATRRWCHPNGSAKALPAMLNAGSAVLARFAPEDADPNDILRLQQPGLPFSPRWHRHGACQNSGSNDPRSTRVNPDDGSTRS